MPTTSQLIHDGDLAGARAALVDAVKSAPTDAARRFELAELQIVLGEWERAEGQLSTLSTQDPSWTPLTAALRQLIRAALARQEVFEAGRAPELAVEPTPELESALRALVAARGGETPPEPSEDVGAALTGECGDEAFVGLRDLDDRLAGVLEILTGDGRYLWAPWSAVRSLELRPAERLRDLVWRTAELDLDGGPSGLVHIPALYPAPAGELTDALRLGRATDWIEDGAGVRGVGQRCLLVGEHDLAFGEIASIRVAPASGR